MLSWLIPKISIDKRENLFLIDINRLSIDSMVMGKKDWQQYFNTRGMSLDLRNRSLRYLSIPHQILPRLVAENSNLTGANLSLTQLDGANFAFTNLQGADLSFSRLRGAYLHYTQLQGANLNNSRLQGAYMHHTELQGSDLSNSYLQGAFLPYAQLQGTSLNGSNFDGTYLFKTNFFGAEGISRISTIQTTTSNESAVTYEKPKLEDIDSWATKIEDLEYRTLFVNKMNKAIIEKSASIIDLNFNDALSVSAIIKSLCRPYENSAIAMHSILERNVVFKMSIQNRLADAINTKPECVELKSKLTSELVKSEE